MTLSNFDWTDKTSVKWFLMLSTGHEGPYSFLVIESRRVSADTLIWAEGLPKPISFELAQERFNDEELMPPLPPIPIEGEVFVPLNEVVEEDIAEAERPPKSKKNWIVAVILLVTVIYGLNEWIKGKEQFRIRRAERMSPELFSRINQDFKFGSWSQKIFFKEYVPSDMSHIWFVNAGFQECTVEAQFVSIKGKLLAKADEKVAFKSTTNLKNHLVEFSNFEFSSGNKIIPGLYEVDLKASDCAWGSVAASIGNLFQPPEENYIARMKVVLYHKGNVEFNAILDKLIRKKLDFEIKNENQEELFWQDLHQKLQTLMAITLQIEQLLLDFSEKPAVDFKINLKKMVDEYTKKYGGILTEFVVQNEKYFKTLENAELSNMTQKRTYEETVRITSKNIGFESMKIIEQLQSWKKPSSQDLERMQNKVKKQFEILKDSLNQRIIQLTEDRAN